ncbi:methylmalonyl Co-A mutase-associated GTPase MeaB [Fervidibacillus halotolerans]|uniref:Methylmalonyl Co-A mutase-associated GTPase MeaB n=1 Tax=Fervidibacillus halotolerans TaxID=2980027 RepID=A0A9E8RX61_9BACI|nr:methylmalonyl Co-A mutase-associated GTPase MeaB [Fervidibacillus halotolerans]WAA11401.1 methylmalonyl Co-A mutase-associated GTPase MeaB [Fervidibacillus halotolerans]
MEKKIRYRKLRRDDFSIEQMAELIRKGSRVHLAKGITLIESNRLEDFHKGQELLKLLMPYTGRSIRIGITGVPGAGKSTFIEKLGTYLCQMGKKVAVLAIDPSSTVTHGSILGDKTRMEQLSKEPNAFIRPSPSAGTLGGVHRKTRESILLCEAAGYEIIFVETVGVGQNEVHVRTMVDMFLLLTITGAGDELQGIKKGIVELADGVIVTKADGENRKLAIKTKNEYNQFLKFIRPNTDLWEPKAFTCSSLTGEGIEEIWAFIEQFNHHLQENHLFHEQRKKQLKDWLLSSITERLRQSFFEHEEIKEKLPSIIEQVTEGEVPVSTAVEKMLSLYRK